MLVQEGDALLIGQSVRAVAADYQLLPVAVVPAEGELRQQTLDVHLGAGDRLIAIAALGDLERLLSRKPVPRDQAVSITAYPSAMREKLIELLYAKAGMDAEQAAKALDHPPVSLREGLTRGAAEELREALERQGVACEIRQWS
jgi:hypothetical protein